MPTGATIVEGAVDGLDATGGVVLKPDIANEYLEGILSVRKNSIINWKSFDLAPGDRLRVDTTGGALLNRVIGGEATKIGGYLTQDGWGGPMVLVNTHGIVVQEHGLVSGGNLVLSTLDISDNAFLSKYVQGRTAMFASDVPVAAPLVLETGADVQAEVLGLFGGTVDVADGVTFSLPGIYTVGAAQCVNYNLDAMPSFIMGKGNDLDFRGDIVMGGGSYVEMFGHTVQVTGASVRGADLAYSGELGLVAGTGAVMKTDGGAFSKMQPDVQSGAGNDVTLTDSMFSLGRLYTRADRTVLRGGNTFQVASAELENQTTASEDALPSDPSSGLADQALGTVLDDASHQATETAGRLLDTSSEDTGREAPIMGIEGRPADEAIRTTLAAFEQGDMAFSQYVQQHMDAGRTRMEAHLATEASAADLVAAFTQDASAVNGDRTLDDGAKLAQAFGMISAVWGNQRLTEEEKQELKHAVARSFDALPATARAYLAQLADA